MNQLLARTSVVLHRPVYPRNIGMCARAMGNFGSQNLHIISPRCDWTSSMVRHEARQGATHASELIANATIHTSLDSFLETHGQGVRIAFSARGGGNKRVSEFADLLKRLCEDRENSYDHPLFQPETHIQLHFGTEDDGLTLEELAPMNFICRLPADGTVSSFNLSHAVLLALYILKNELSQFCDVPTGPAHAAVAPLPPGKLEHPKRAIHEWLDALGFDLDSRRITIEATLTRILLSHCPSVEDTRLLEKILFQTVARLKDQGAP